MSFLPPSNDVVTCRRRGSALTVNVRVKVARSDALISITSASSFQRDFVAIVPFGLFPLAQELGESAAIGHLTAWLNVPFSAIVGWIFVSLEKVGENSSNPFEGGANDVPISSIARRIEIEMRNMLGEETDLKPIAATGDILF